AQEGLTNVYKHAQASRVTVAVHFNGGEARMQISDNGRGFDLSALDHLPSNRRDRFGLQGIRERVELAGGQMRIESSPGTGTKVFITLPKNALDPTHDSNGDEG
ncbi:MAG: ATP-binding protein, partial [Anaerolineae bacterium]|nr:ATP-binding protein [Anaerolineae bacterium]